MNSTALIAVPRLTQHNKLPAITLYQEKRNIARAIVAFCDGWYLARKVAKDRSYSTYFTVPKSPDYATLRSVGMDQTIYYDDPEVELIISQIALRNCEPPRGMREEVRFW